MSELVGSPVSPVHRELFEAAENGDVAVLARLLDEDPEKLHAVTEPYELTLLHLAASAGHLAAVELLLDRGLDVNARDKGDNTYPMHWAAAGGYLDVVRRLAAGGGDVIGRGDDHGLEVIGWATGWDGCDDDAHRAVADFLVSHGAQHHIYSAIALGLSDEVRRIVAEDPSALTSRMSRNENNQMPLHYAVRKNRPEMVALLMELGSDPLAVDSAGMPAAAYATAPGIDRTAMEKIRAMTSAELLSGVRGNRKPRLGTMDLVAAVALGDWQMANRLSSESPDLINSGVLHMMTKRNDIPGVRWLLAHGADVNSRWQHWEADVTPLHLAASQRHAEMIHVLLDGGADQSVRDSRYDSDALGWAEFFGQKEIVRILKAEGTKKP
jgi:ankyrin repeat protein